MQPQNITNWDEKKKKSKGHKTNKTLNNKWKEIERKRNEKKYKESVQFEGCEFASKTKNEKLWNYKKKIKIKTRIRTEKKKKR